MTEEQTIRALSDSPRRHCPVCGARIAEDTTTCRMCGTELAGQGSQEGPQETATDTPSRVPGTRASDGTLAADRETRVFKPLRIAILGLVAILILGGSVVLGMNLSQGNLPPEMLPTFTATITATPTETSTPTQTPSPTVTPLPTATATPVPPSEYTVRSGDTLLEIAMEHGLTVDELTSFNNLESEFIVDGQTLLIPPPTPTPGPTPTPEPVDPDATEAPYTLHTVRSGETLSTIAEQYGVTVNDIRIASRLPSDSETIQINQVLTIPRVTPTPQPEVIASGGTPTPTPGLMRYPAPQMLHPRDTAEYHGADETIALQWASVGILDAREYYQVELIVPTDGEKKIVHAFVKSTVWRVPADLFPPETMKDRTFSWRVTVVRQVTENADPDRIISPGSRRRTFTWALN